MSGFDKRLADLERRMGGGDDDALLRLFSHTNDPETRAELERRLAAGVGSPGMRDACAAMLFAQRQVAAEDAAEQARLDAGEGDAPVTIQ